MTLLKCVATDEVRQRSSQVAQAGPRSLKAHQDLADKDLQKWLRRKAVRQQKYEALKASPCCTTKQPCKMLCRHATMLLTALLQEKCECLREQMGLVGSSVPVKTITLYVVDGLSMELQQLQAERAERQQSLDLHFKELRKMCMVLGEDEGALAAAIHPTLGTSRWGQESEHSTERGLLTMADWQKLFEACQAIIGGYCATGMHSPAIKTSVKGPLTDCATKRWSYSSWRCDVLEDTTSSMHPGLCHVHQQPSTLQA